MNRTITLLNQNKIQGTLGNIHTISPNLAKAIKTEISNFTNQFNNDFALDVTAETAPWQNGGIIEMIVTPGQGQGWGIPKRKKFAIIDTTNGVLKRI